MNEPIDIATNIAQNIRTRLAVCALMESIRETAIQGEGCSIEQVRNAIDRGFPAIGVLSLSDLILAEIEERFGEKRSP